MKTMQQNTQQNTQKKNSKKAKRTIGLGLTALVVAAGGAIGVGASQSDAAPGTVQTASASLNVRSGPSTNSAIVGTVAKGKRVNIICQTYGTAVSGTYRTSKIWDKIGPGRYVSDAFVYTGSNGFVAPKCGAPKPGNTGNTGNTGDKVTRKWGNTISYNTGAGGQCTWGAYKKFKEYSGVYPLVRGNAKDMAGNARANGWTVTYEPHAHAMVVFQPGVHGANRTYGHVAWVTSVHGKTVNIVEMNYKGKWIYNTRTVTDVSGMQYILAPKAR